MRAIVSYLLLRGALFIAPFAILVAAQVEWYVALVVALLFAFAASAVFLRRQKAAVSAEIARMRGERGERDDEDVEDEAVDAERATGADASVAAGPREAEDGTVATTTTDPDLVTDEETSAAEGDERRDR